MESLQPADNPQSPDSEPPDAVVQAPPVKIIPKTNAAAAAAAARIPVISPRSDISSPENGLVIDDCLRSPDTGVDDDDLAPKAIPLERSQLSQPTSTASSPAEPAAQSTVSDVTASEANVIKPPDTGAVAAVTNTTGSDTSSTGRKTPVVEAVTNASVTDTEATSGVSNALGSDAASSGRNTPGIKEVTSVDKTSSEPVSSVSQTTDADVVSKAETAVKSSRVKLDDCLMDEALSL